MFLEKTYRPWFSYNKDEKTSMKRYHASLIFALYLLIFSISYAIEYYNYMIYIAGKWNISALFVIAVILICIAFLDMIFLYKTAIYNKYIDKFENYSETYKAFIYVMSLLFLASPLALLFLLPEKM